MQINRRVTNGLAWAGLCLVVGVPTLDFITGQLMAEPASANAGVAVISPVEAPVPAPLSQRPAAPVAKPVETAAVQPAEPVAAPVVKPAAAASGGPAVDNFLASGRPLPSYITEAGTPAAAPVAVAATPKPSVTAPVANIPAPAAVAAIPPIKTQAPVAAPVGVATDPVQVAAVTPQRIAPIPMPLSMRPKPVPQALVANQPATQPIVIPADVAINRPPTDMVGADDLESWEFGPLSDFLAQQQGRGVAPRGSSASVTFDEPVYPPADVYEPRRNVLIGPVQDEPYFPFVN